MNSRPSTTDRSKVVLGPARLFEGGSCSRICANTIENLIAGMS